MISFFCSVVNGLNDYGPSSPGQSQKALALVLPVNTAMFLGFILAWNRPLFPHNILETAMRLRPTCFHEQSHSLSTRLRTSISPEQTPWLWHDTHSSCHWQVSGTQGQWNCRHNPLTGHLHATGRHWNGIPPNHQSREFKCILHFTTSPNTFPTKERKAT